MLLILLTAFLVNFCTILVYKIRQRWINSQLKTCVSSVQIIAKISAIVSWLLPSPFRISQQVWTFLATIMEDFRRKLEQLNPNVTLSVELPHQGNGDLFQARTTIADGLIFYGRATTEDEAILKCCQKAVKHLLKNNNNLNVSETHSRRSSSSKQQSPARPPSRRNRETPRLSSHPRRGLSSREEELRNEMGSVLDRVAEWSRYYDHNGNSEYTNNNDYGNRRRYYFSRKIFNPTFSAKRQRLF